MAGGKPTVTTSSGRPRTYVNWAGIGLVIVVLLIIGLWAGIKATSTPQPAEGQPLPCPSSAKFKSVEQGNC